MMMKTKRLFTLLEIMIAFVLLTLSSSLIGWRMHKAIEKKRYQSELNRLSVRLITCQKLAVASQSDWQGVFKKKQDEWVFQTRSEEEPTKQLSPLNLRSLTIFFNGKSFDQLTIDFFSSGKVLPEGTLMFVHLDERVEWNMSEIFQRNEGMKSGPLHPSSE